MFPVFFGLIAQLYEMIELVEQLLAGAVDLGVGLTHVLVERLVVVDRGLQGGDVAGVVVAVVRGSILATGAGGVFSARGFVRGL